MWHDARAGMAAAAPMLVGVIPFGLVAGASPVAKGMSGLHAVGFSTILFAGASQLAAIDVLGDGGSVLVAVVAACTINLRILLYSASLAPHLAHVPLGSRLLAAYVLVDQNYALSIARWSSGDEPPERRLPFFVGAGALLWASWQLATIAGVVVGGSVPDDVPLDFAVPLVFLVLLVPVLGSPPALAAGIGGGGGAVLAAELGAADLAVLLGALAGIAAGVVAELVTERRGPAPLLEESS